VSRQTRETRNPATAGAPGIRTGRGELDFGSAAKVAKFDLGLMNVQIALAVSPSAQPGVKAGFDSGAPNLEKRLRC
jgi:hypothetical protein